MPTLQPAGCRAPGCNRRQEPSRRFCSEHERAKWQQLDHGRGTRQQRGYDQAYLKFRNAFMSHPDNVLCADCAAAGRTTLSAELHHRVKVKDARELRCVWSNAVALCTACHAIRTRRGE